MPPYALGPWKSGESHTAICLTVESGMCPQRSSVQNSVGKQERKKNFKKSRLSFGIFCKQILGFSKSQMMYLKIPSWISHFWFCRKKVLSTHWGVRCSQEIKCTHFNGELDSQIPLVNSFTDKRYQLLSCLLIHFLMIVLPITNLLERHNQRTLHTF